MELHNLTLTAAAERIRARQVSSEELTRACLDRIGATEDKLKAFVVVTGDQALEAARRADADAAAGHYHGPLHGIPVAVKDLCDIAGLPTTSSSLVRADYMPDADAAIVERLKAAGAVIVGKTHTHEFAYGIETPTTRNPWNPTTIPGGSSGGSGATVAAGGAFMGIGTDTGGSIRIPASLCGTVGLKPTYGRVSRAGVTSLSWSLDHVGPLTRSVRDAALSLAVLAGYDVRDPGSINAPVPDYLQGLDGGVKGVRLGIPRNFYFDRIEPETERLVRDAIAELERQGAVLVEVDLPLADLYMAVEFGICMPEASAYHQEMLRAKATKYNDDVRTSLEVGEMIAATDYIKALRVRQRIKDGWRDAFQSIDALVAPSVPAVAVAAGQTSFTWADGTEEALINAYVRLSAPGNITGLPAISVPCGFTNAGLPAGLQILGKPFAEPMVLRIAEAYERSTAWHERHPAL
jgi:aspartyl-tRNA(Asn)/glutamyl-tRNA(Gln) amidotransferase subunit A